MSEQVIAIYCFVDDFFKAIGKKTEAHCRLTDAQVLTIALLSARFFYGNYSSAFLYLQQHHGFARLDKSNLCRRLHQLKEPLMSLFNALSGTLKQLNTSSRYLIDSFPVAVCDNIRICRCKLLQGEAYRGKSASKRRYFYGFRVQVITTEEGVPIDFFIHAGAFVDVTALQAMQLNLPEGSVVYADSGYTDYEQEDLYALCDQIQLLVARKSNTKRADEPWQAFLKDHFRKRIETTFSGITALFPKKIHATSTPGFILKVILFIFAYTLNQCI